MEDANVALERLREEARSCTACPLHGPATRTVFGEGRVGAPLMFVGEQPGDQEDLQGRPFVGPAGQLFDRALAQAGVDRRDAYVTNAVKHFKFTARGKRRIHAKPDAGEIEACKFWILKELDTVGPRVIAALGATAARSLTGKTVTISRERGHFRRYDERRELFITVHPSFLLRIEDERAQREEFGRFVSDLRQLDERVQSLAAERGPEETPSAGEKEQLSLL